MTHKEKQKIEIHLTVKNEEKDKLTEEALKEVDTLAVVDHGEIKKWSKELK